MDIAGAKALKERLGLEGAQKASRGSARAEVPAEAPPVYHWVGVSNVPARNPSADVDETSATTGASLFSRIGLSYR